MLLLETYTNYVIEEDKLKTGKKRLHGLFQKSNAKNENNRVYSEGVLKREVGSYQELIKDRRSMGQLDHPDNPKMNLDRVSHLVTELTYQNNGDVIGTLEVISTPCGNILNELINSGVKVGISSRGVGSIEEQGGYMVVQEDYKLLAFDIVAEPSTKGAYPESLSEEILRFIQSSKGYKQDAFRKALVTFCDKHLI